MRKNFLKITAIFLAFLSIFEFNFGKIIFAEDNETTTETTAQEITLDSSGKVIVW